MEIRQAYKLNLGCLFWKQIWQSVDICNFIAVIVLKYRGILSLDCLLNKWKVPKFQWLTTVFHVQQQQSGHQIRVRNQKLFFLFLIQNLCCGCSKEPSYWNGSFEHPKQMLKQRDKKIFTNLRWNVSPIWTYAAAKRTMIPLSDRSFSHAAKHIKNLPSQIKIFYL